MMMIVCEYLVIIQLDLTILPVTREEALRFITKIFYLWNKSKLLKWKYSINTDGLTDNNPFLVFTVVDFNATSSNGCIKDKTNFKGTKIDSISSSALESRQYEIARMRKKFILQATWMKVQRESNRRKQEGSILFLFFPLIKQRKYKHCCWRNCRNRFFQAYS